MNEIDEELMKKFDELQQDVINKMRESDIAEQKFFEFMKNLKNREFKVKDSENRCKITCIFQPRWKQIEDGFITHERLNFNRHWYSKEGHNCFANFCNALRSRTFLILKKDKNEVDVKL